MVGFLALGEIFAAGCRGTAPLNAATHAMASATAPVNAATHATASASARPLRLFRLIRPKRIEIQEWPARTLRQFCHVSANPQSTHPRRLKAEDSPSQRAHRRRDPSPPPHSRRVPSQLGHRSHTPLPPSHSRGCSKSRPRPLHAIFRATRTSGLSGTDIPVCAPTSKPSNPRSNHSRNDRTQIRAIFAAPFP